MSNANRLNDNDEDDDTDDNDDEEKHWFYPRTSSPHSSLSVNNSFTHQSSSATIGSWGFDVNRSTHNNSNADQQTTIKDYNECLADKLASSDQDPKLRSPTLTKQRDGNEFAAIDRLVLGPHRLPNDSSSQPSINRNNDVKLQAEQELLAWQSRMLQKDQRIDDSSSKFSSKLTESNSFHSSSRQTTTANRRIPTMLTKHENQHAEYDHYEATIKSTRATKRYIELVYHLQSFYERLVDQLSNGHCFFKTNQSLFDSHCRKITEQVEKCKPIWEAKLAELQKQLIQLPTETNQITFLKRRLTLINLLQILKKGTELDATDQSIRTDIDRVLHEDRLAVQLQDELSTLLQHQSLLHDFTSLLQWNCLIYSSNEQNRVENILPFLRAQTTTTDNYITHVSKQLTELVTNIRSSEKYILSYTNTIPSIDDGISSPQLLSLKDESWRSNNKNDISPTKTKEYRLQQARQNENANDHSPKIRSTSVPRYKTSGDSVHKLDRDDLRISINTNNSNNNVISTRYAAVKSAKREVNTQSNVKSILKSYPQTHSKRAEYDTNRERDEERKFFSKPLNPLDDDLRSSYDLKGSNRSRQKAYNLQSMLADDKKPTSRYFAGKHLNHLCETNTYTCV